MFLLNYLLIITSFVNICLAINSYIYLPDKYVQEELPIGSLIIDLNDDLQTYYMLKQQIAPITEQYTFLEDKKSSVGTNTYFLLDFVTGRVTTKRYIDRESMCLNRHCAELCDSQHAPNMHSGKYTSSVGAGGATSMSVSSNGVSSDGNCKINLKVLLMPSSNIVSINIIIEDINDNKPQFRKDVLNQTILENVPVGYRIPIDMAYDPDIGRNTIQYYEIVELGTPLKVINSMFELVQNLSEPQLYLIVKQKLDRETQAEYSLSIVAHDGGVPEFSGKVDVYIQVLDVNDNNPQFDKDVYKFFITEDTKIATEIGYVHAYDADEGQNGKIKYSLIGSILAVGNGNGMPTANAMQNYANYFNLNLYSGLLTLKKELDYEDEPYFSLTVEARDCGIGSLPAYATIEIYLVDCNDNSPEISVSFLHTLRRTTDANQTIIIYMNENTEPNKFIAHVSIIDRDSGDNGRIGWRILLNNEELLNQNNGLIIKTTPLNNNSFTVNTGSMSSQLLDREFSTYFNISIIAWDYGRPKRNYASYNFSIILLDENDNAPKFEKSVYNLTMHENNRPDEIIIQLQAFDSDLNENGEVSYKIVESEYQEYFSIDEFGYLKAKISFDREEREFYEFNVMAYDHGKKVQMNSTVLVRLTILDVNDNEPFIAIDNTSLSSVYIRNYSNTSIILSIPESLEQGSEIIRLVAIDGDIGVNAQSTFSIMRTLNDAFKITSNGKLMVARKLDRELQDVYKMVIVCENNIKIPKIYKASINVQINIEDSNDNCPTDVSQGLRITFVNKVNRTASNNDLFESNFTDLDLGRNSKLMFELLTHNEIVEYVVETVNGTVPQVYTVRIRFLRNIKLPRLKLGRYFIKFKVSDQGDPVCSVMTFYEMHIGDGVYWNKDLLIDKLNSTNKEDPDLYQYDELTKEELGISVGDVEEDSDEAYSSNTQQIETSPVITKQAVFDEQQFTNEDKYHILSYILIVFVVIIIAIFFMFLVTICFYKKYQRRHRRLVKKEVRVNGQQQQQQHQQQQQQQHIMPGIMAKEKIFIFKHRPEGLVDTDNTERLLTPVNNANNASDNSRLSFSTHSTQSNHTNSSADSLASSAITKETKLNHTKSSSSADTNHEKKLVNSISFSASNTSSMVETTARSTSKSANSSNPNDSPHLSMYDEDIDEMIIIKHNSKQNNYVYHSTLPAYSEYHKHIQNGGYYVNNTKTDHKLPKKSAKYQKTNNIDHPNYRSSEV